MEHKRMTFRLFLNILIEQLVEFFEKKKDNDNMESIINEKW